VQRVKGLARMRWQAVILLVAIMTVACENPASPGRHLHAYGVALTDGSNEIVRARGDVMVGDMSLMVGERRGPYTVLLLDRDGQPLEVPSGYWLRVVPSAPDIVRWLAPTEGAFSGSIEGGAPGAATLEFCLLHGAVGRGHDDGCQLLPVVVQPK
jgi:hypothetical protein